MYGFISDGILKPDKAVNVKLNSSFFFLNRRMDKQKKIIFNQWDITEIDSRGLVCVIQLK